MPDYPHATVPARRNVQLNPGAEVTLGAVDVRRAVLRPFDVVVANLTGTLLVSSSTMLSSLTAPSGHLILSGFLESEAHDVCAAFAGWRIERRVQKEEWGCVTLSREGSGVGA